MANNVKIGGATVDIDDPCAYAAALRKERAKLITGGGVGEIDIQDFNGRRRTRFNAGSMTALDAEIARQEDLCAQSTGSRKARFAMRAGFRRIP